MLYSKTCEYAIRALSCLASEGKNVWMHAKDISEKTGVPDAYICKIFQDLVRNGILKSRRGALGGFAYRVDPSQISLRRIVEIIDDTSILDDCVMGLDECSDDNACPLHPIWKKSKEQMLKKLETNKLTLMTKKIRTRKFRTLRRSRLNTNLQLSGASGAPLT